MTRTWSAVLARLGVPTGDGRIIAPAGGSSRDLPLPLMWQELSDDGHGGSRVVARMETLRIGDGMVTATGTMLDSAPSAVIEQLEAGLLGPSVDLDDIEYVMDDQERLVITKWRIAGATLVAIPAFADVSLTLDPEPVTPYGNVAEWSAETATAHSTAEAHRPVGSAVLASTNGNVTASLSQTSTAQRVAASSSPGGVSETWRAANPALNSGSGTGTTLGHGHGGQTPTTPGPGSKPQRESGGRTPVADGRSARQHGGAKPSDWRGSGGIISGSFTTNSRDSAESAECLSTSPQGTAPSSQPTSTTTTGPASFADGSAHLVTGVSEHSGMTPNSFGGHWDGLSHESMALTASANGLAPPLDWFRDPQLTQATPLTICPPDELGRVRVFGTIAPWGSCHIGLPGCVTPPFSASGYTYFHVAEQATAEGAVLPVGTLVAGPRHADAQLAFQAAQQHYDDPSAAVARVVAGEDEHGIWVAGWMVPGATPQAVDIFRSSPVSGDWRRIGGSLEMIAVCSVNAPGFPVPRARVAFSNGAQRTLIGSFGITPVSGVLPEPGNKPKTDSSRARWAWHMANGEQG